MIKEYLNDLRWMSMGGIIAFLTGWLLNTGLLMMFGVSLAFTGSVLYTIIDKENKKTDGNE